MFFGRFELTPNPFLRGLQAALGGNSYTYACVRRYWLVDSIVDANLRVKGWDVGLIQAEDPLWDC
jgi:hypothetical protein